VRALKASEEFTQHGMSETVTLTHRNVCKDGFTVLDAADSVFLDLPAPWEAIDFAKTALRKDRITRICCFSPCMEQVMRTVSALNDSGFTDIKMYETLIRPHEVTQLPPLRPIRDIGEDLKALALKRENKRQRQIAQSRARHQQPNQDAESSGAAKRKRDMDEEDELQADDTSKRIKTDDEEAGEVEVALVPASDIPVIKQDLHSEPLPASSASPGAALNVSRSFSEVRGHTSYLTFACLVPEALYGPPQQTAPEQMASN